MGGSARRKVKIYEEEYASVTDFCIAYGLKYVSAVKYLNKGWEPEDIVEVMGGLPTTARAKTGGNERQFCTYKGISYPSAFAAAESLGLPPHAIYNYKKQHNCSTNEAIQKLMDCGEAERIIGQEEIEARKRPIMVAGTLYPTKMAACETYGVPYISVRSRMQRKNLSFEEALVSGSFAGRKMRVKESLWDNSITSLAHYEPTSADMLWQELQKIFETANYDISNFYLPEKEQAIILIKENLNGVADERNVYILFRHPHKAQIIDIEFVIPELLDIPIDKEKRASLLEALNMVNQQYLGCQVSLLGNYIQGRGILTISKRSINHRLFFSSLFGFLGTAGHILNILSDSLCAE